MNIQMGNFLCSGHTRYSNPLYIHKHHLVLEAGTIARS